jgi:hypothetical protein
MVLGSIPSGVTGFFSDIFLSDHTMALGSTQPLVKGRFLGVKAAGVWGWQPHHLHMPNVMKSGSLNLLEPSGPLTACYGTPLPNLILKCWKIDGVCETTDLKVCLMIWPVYFCTYAIVLVICCHQLLLAQFLQIRTFTWSSHAGSLIMQEGHLELGIVEFKLQAFRADAN